MKALEYANSIRHSASYEDLVKLAEMLELEGLNEQYDEVNKVLGFMCVRSNDERFAPHNAFILCCERRRMGYTANKWFTFKQAQAAGYTVRKGEKGTKIFRVAEGEKELENGDLHKYKFGLAYTVFNLDQMNVIEGRSEFQKEIHTNESLMIA